MGKSPSKHCQEREAEIIELSNLITSADDYDSVSYSMFNDGTYNLGRVEVWYVMSCAVRDRLVLDQRIRLNTYFMKWLTKFSRHLPDEKQRLETIQTSWRINGDNKNKSGHVQNQDF